MRTALAGFALISGLALAVSTQAQTPSGTQNNSGNNPSAPAMGTTSPPATGATTATPNGIVDRNTGKAAAGGQDNQAVATTNANASQPAHGANSFTMGEARGRIASQGFQNVADLHKDNQGVWRGKAMKNGAQVNVWLDYKGNIGQQ